MLVFDSFFSIPVISQIVSIGMGSQEGREVEAAEKSKPIIWIETCRRGGRWGWVGSRRQVKTPIWTQTTVLCL